MAPAFGDKAGEKPVMDASQTSCCCGSDLWWSGRPARVMALKDCRVKDIACGESHCVALDLEGQAYAWGIDEMGQLGASNRHAADIAVPQEVSAKPLDIYRLPVTVAEQVSHLPVCVNPLESCSGAPCIASMP